jgi:hypothetical protein
VHQHQAPLHKLSHNADIQLAIAADMRRKDEPFMREVFHRHADGKDELSRAQLMAALQEVRAPVLSCDDSSSDSLFRRADANISGAVDFHEYATAMFCCTLRSGLLIGLLPGSCELLPCRMNWRCFSLNMTCGYA